MNQPRLTRPCVDGLHPYTPGKPIEEVEREYGLTDIVKLASNENPLGPSPAAVDAIREAAADVRLYPDNDCYHLKRALSERLGVPPGQVLTGHGSDEIIHNIGLAFLSPGDQVMMCAGPFSQYDFTAKLMDATPVYIPMVDWRYDIPEMVRRLSPRTKVVFIGSPNNPTGSIVTHAELDDFVAALPESTVLVIDEAYHEYVDDPDYPDALALVREGRTAIVLRTFSKVYALAGLRIGYGATTPELSAALERVREPFNVSSVAQAAALASLADADQVMRTRTLNSQSKEYLYGELSAMGLTYTPSHANFVWVDLGRECGPFVAELLRRGVIVRPGDAFRAPTHIRVTTGTPEQNERFATSLREVLASQR